MNDAHEEFSAAVLDLVDRIPRGRVLTYGSIAEHLRRGGPRGVGGVLARDGAAVAWWRVVRADGTLAAHLMVAAQQHWHLESTPLRRGIVDIGAARWWPAAPTHDDEQVADHLTGSGLRGKRRRAGGTCP